jgi:tetratricopeptide (TPR) repeat protein
MNRLTDRRLKAITLLICLWMTAGPPALAQDDPVLESLRRAQAQIVSGELAGAESALTQLLRKAPEDARVHNLLGVVKAQQGASERAEALFLASIELAPGYTDAYLNLGRLYLENLGSDPKGRDKAIETYRRLLRREPQNIEALYQCAFLLHLKEDYAASQDLLLRLSTEEQGYPQALSLACANFAALGRQEKAGAAAERLIADPRLEEADVAAILPALRRAGRDDLVVRLLQTLSDRGRLSLGTTEQLAFLHLELGDASRGKRLLENLAGRHPNMPELLIKLAWLAFSSRDHEGALSYLAHARDLAPHDGRIHLFFGIACVELGLGLEAVNSLEQAVQIDPENPYYNYVLGVAILHWQEPEKAIPYFEKYCRMLPDDPRGTAALAEAHFLNKDHDKAREEFEKVLDQAPTRVAAHYYLGAIARLQQRLDESLEHLSKAIELQPDHADALAELGWIYTRRAEFDKAEAMLQKAIQLQPDHYQGHFHLMGLYARTRDSRYQAQREHFEKIKEKRWERLTAALRTIEAVPRQVMPGGWFNSIPSEGTP